MVEHPFFFDIVLIVLLMPVLEVAIMRKNYRVLSPVTMFFAAIFILYVLPYLVHFHHVPNMRLAKLSYDQFALAFNTLRCFLYTFCVVIILKLSRAARLEPSTLTLNYARVKSRAVIAFMLLCVAVVLKLGIGVGFSPSAMVDRAINPRAYTYIRAGMGPMVHILWALRYSTMALAAVIIYRSGRSIGSIIFFVICAGLTIIGGTKATFLLPFIMLIIVWQKMTLYHRNPLAKFRRTIFAGALGGFLVLVGFTLWGEPGHVTRLRDVAPRFVAYHKEAFYLPLVIERFPWSPEYPATLVLDTFIAPVPRLFWPGKPAYGLWQRYFRPTFEPNTVFYHTSTFGCLSEAHMLLGVFGPFVYGIIWALVCYKLYVYMISHNSLFKAFIVGTTAFWIYLLARTGFMGVNVSIMLIYMFIGWLLLRGTTQNQYEEPLSDEYIDQPLPYGPLWPVTGEKW